MCEELSHCLAHAYGISFEPKNAQIHCLMHVVNLIVQHILFVAKEVKNDPEYDDYYAMFCKHLPIHFDINVEHQEEADTTNEADPKPRTCIPLRLSIHFDSLNIHSNH